MRDPLTAIESSRLTACESAIERGLGTFIEVGGALAEIRDLRLYRQTHGTFEDYCRERWRMSRRHANRLVEAAEVAGNLGPIGPNLPASESVARPLAVLVPEQQREAWKEAVQTAPNGKVTAAHVQAVVERRAEPERPVVQPRIYTTRMKSLVAAAVDAASATDEEIAAIQANDMMLLSLRNARDLIDRIIAHHSKGRKHG